MVSLASLELGLALVSSYNFIKKTNIKVIPKFCIAHP